MSRLLIALALLSGCGGAVCGPGTHESDGVCLPDPVPPPPPVVVAPPVVLPEVLPPTAPAPSLDSLRIEVAADGALRIDGVAVTDEELAARVAGYRGRLNDPASASVHLVAPPDAPHARLIAVMDRLRAEGVGFVSIETSAPEANSP